MRLEGAGLSPPRHSAAPTLYRPPPFFLVFTVAFWVDAFFASLATAAAPFFAAVGFELKAFERPDFTTAFPEVNEGAPLPAAFFTPGFGVGAAFLAADFLPTALPGLVPLPGLLTLLLTVARAVALLLVLMVFFDPCGLLLAFDAATDEATVGIGPLPDFAGARFTKADFPVGLACAAALLDLDGVALGEVTAGFVATGLAGEAFVIDFGDAPAGLRRSEARLSAALGSIP